MYGVRKAAPYNYQASKAEPLYQELVQPLVSAKPCWEPEHLLPSMVAMKLF